MIVRLLLAELAGAVGRDVGHRAGAVERDEGDDVLEPVGAHFDQRLAHAGAFQLEHPDRLAAPEHLVGFRVVERDFSEIDLDPAPGDEANGALKRGQRLQAQEVELDQPRRFHPFHVELGRRHRRLRIAVERHELGQRPVADDDARRMGRGVGIESFEPLGDGEHVRHPLVGLGRLLQSCFVRHRLLQRDRMGGVHRHQLGELVDLAERHLQHPADVAHDAAGEERAEGDDLRHPVGAVAVAHIGDHLVAPVLAEVDVEVRHRHALGVEETLEQEAEAHRVEVGDGERPGDERAGAGPASRPDRNVLRLRPFDEVGDDEEVAGELHLDDDVELEGEALVVVLARYAPAQGRDGRDAPSSPSRACRRSSSSSSTASPPGMEKRGRMGFRVSGR